MVDQRTALKIQPPPLIAKELDKLIGKSVKNKNGWARFNITLAPVVEAGSWPPIKGQRWAKPNESMSP